MIGDEIHNILYVVSDVYTRLCPLPACPNGARTVFTWLHLGQLKNVLLVHAKSESKFNKC